MRRTTITDPLTMDHQLSPDFDRVYFNLHGKSRDEGFAVLGIGTYPPKRTMDGYLCLVDGKSMEQRNLRVSTTLDEAGGDIGPLSWSCDEPHNQWRLKLAANDSGVAFELAWTARTDIFEIPDYRTSDESGASRYAHLFQSGRYTGWLEIDGTRRPVDGWMGQRDRSKGTRRTHDRLGMHLWVQCQFEGECIGFLYNEDRQNNTSHFAGAAMKSGGGLNPVAELRHALEFNDDFELVGGTFLLGFADGTRRELAVESTGPGIFMQGGGYAGWHGVPRGRGHVESERWPFDGSRTPRNLELGITDTLCNFRCGSVNGLGITEYAISRSPAFTYRSGGTRVS